MNRVCIRYGRSCSDGGVAVPGRSRCRAHGGGAWARQPPARQVEYSSGEYQQNRRLVIAREPTCHWRLPGCTQISTTADHVLGLSKGGDHALPNLVGSCRSCNEKRGGAEGRARRKAQGRRG